MSKLYSSHPSSSSEAVRVYSPPSRQTNHHVVLLECPKEFFQGPVVGTPLGKALDNLKMSKAVPEGLKPQECEHGSSRVKLPIPYIPEKDDLNEAGEPAPPSSSPYQPRWSYGCPCGHAVPQKSTSCTTSKQVLPSRQRAYRRPTRSLFGPRRSATRSSRKRY